jgi:uncharacterized membrane protein
MTLVKKSSGQTISESLRLDSTVVRAAIISETVVFCTLVLLGGGLFALFATTNLNWYYPTVFYGVVVYIAWQRYFGISVRAEETTQVTDELEAAERSAGIDNVTVPETAESMPVEVSIRNLEKAARSIEAGSARREVILREILILRQIQALNEEVKQEAAREERTKTSDNPMFLYAGEYESVEDAKADLETLREMHREHIVGTYDAAVVTKNEEGKVKIVDKIEKPTQHGGWAGMAVGAAMGLIFPPGILVGGLLGAGAGALIGHLGGGMSRSDVKEVGEMVDNSEAALIVVGEATVERAVGDATRRAKRELKKEIRADAKEVEQEIDTK